MLPHEEDVTQDGEDQAREDAPRVAVALVQAHAVQKHERHQGEDGEAFRHAEEDRGALFLAEEHKEDGDSLEEGHEFRPYAFQLWRGKNYTG